MSTKKPTMIIDEAEQIPVAPLDRNPSSAEEDFEEMPPDVAAVAAEVFSAPEAPTTFTRAGAQGAVETVDSKTGLVVSRAFPET